ncbi:hypothetical protein AB0H00_30905 [Nocardia sp. NPDC023852]|uniref:hypothetical protein n=1 Tax=Nocardia sp. NPDC023852 TaxID=3154697 RepID=UPI0033FCA80F
MFRRKPNPDLAATTRGADDPLLTADLPERVATGRDRLAYQSDPALREALSERELQAERALAERVREHERIEQLAELETAEATAAEVRKTTTELVRTEARDLMQSRRALADQRREASPHAQLAHLYRIKRWSGRGLAGVVAGSMLFSAANVQHNLAPGGPSEPLYWMSYLLEALISTVLVVFMVSGSAVARWKITEGETTIRWTEAGLLAGSILLNTYPYLRSPQDWSGVAVHSVAPIMMGVALFGHTAVAKRMGAAIAKASLELSVTDDTAERLAELLARAHTTVTQPPAPQQAAEPLTDDAVLADFEREFTPAPQQPPHFATHESADGQHSESAGSAGTSSTSPEVVAESAPHYTSAGSAGSPHLQSAGAAEPEEIVADPAPHQPVIESAGPAVEVADDAPAPARTKTSTASTSTDVPAQAVSAGEMREEVRASRAPRSRTAHPARTSGAGSSAPASAGARAQSALALATAESAGESAGGGAGSSAQVRGALIALAEEVRARGIGRRLDLDTVVRVLEMAAADASTNAIKEATGVHRTTVDKIRTAADVVRAEAIAGGDGGRVIELRKPADRT